jgi:plastocyanin
MSSFRLSVLSAFLIFAVACGSGYSPSSPSNSPSPAPPTDPTPSRSISIPAGASTRVANAFVPQADSVSVGDTVTWTNTDVVEHTSTADGKQWDSGVVAPGAQFSFTFQTAGTYTYKCLIHPGMVGTIVVQ